MMFITTLVVSFLVCCMLEVRCGYAGVVSGLQPGHYSIVASSWFLFFSYHNDARSNKHQIKNVTFGRRIGSNEVNLLLC